MFADAVFGVAVVSRYVPVLVDWREEFGGSGLPIRLVGETLELAELMRAELTSRVPEFEAAHLTVKQRFY